MIPSTLDKADLLGFLAQEIGDSLAQEFGRRQKIGIKDGHKRVLNSRQGMVKCACLIAGPIGAVDGLDVDTQLLPMGDAAVGPTATSRQSNRPGPVSGAVLGIVLVHAGIDQSFDDIFLVVDGQLNGDAWQVVISAKRTGLVAFLLASPSTYASR